MRRYRETNSIEKMSGRGGGRDHIHVLPRFPHMRMQPFLIHMQTVAHCAHKRLARCRKASGFPGALLQSRYMQTLVCTKVLCARLANTLCMKFSLAQTSPSTMPTTIPSLSVGSSTPCCDLMHVAYLTGWRRLNPKP